MTPSEAYNYIKGILPDFQRKGETLAAQLNAANLLRAKMRQSGFDDTEITQVYEAILEDYNQWRSIVNQLQPMLSLFGISSLGDPISIATLLYWGGTLIAVAAAVGFFYTNNRINQHATAIRTISKYVEMTPEDQAIVNDATTQSWFTIPGLESIGTYLLWGGAIYLAIYLFKK